MKTGGNGGLWLKDANLPPHLSDHLLTHGYQPRLWLKDRAQGPATKLSKGLGSAVSLAATYHLQSQEEEEL